MRASGDRSLTICDLIIIAVIIIIVVVVVVVVAVVVDGRNPPVGLGIPSGTRRMR